MRWRKASTILVGLVVIIGLTFSGCGTWKYRGYYTLTYWTNQNFDTFEAVYKSAAPEEQAFLRAYVSPYLNILRHTCIAIGAIEDENDVKLRAELIIIAKIGMNAGIATINLRRALENKDPKEAIKVSGAMQTKAKLLLGVVK